MTVNELVRGVRIALDQARLDGCSAFDVDRDGTVGIDELIVAVENAFCCTGSRSSRAPVPSLS